MKPKNAQCLHPIPTLKFVVLVLFALSQPALSCFAGNCTYTLTPAATNCVYSGLLGAFSVNVSSGCAWSAATTNSWLHTTASGSGPGQAPFLADPNPATVARVGAITAGGKTFVVNQAAAPLTIGTALNSPELVWETSPDYPWLPTNSPAFDGLHSAVSGNEFVHDSTSWLRTTLVGPGTLSFWWLVDSDVTDAIASFDAMYFDLNGEPMDQAMGVVDWTYHVYEIPPGTNVVTWRYVKDAQYNYGQDRACLDQVKYTTNQSPLQMALNTCGVAWNTGGNTNPTFWTSRSDVAHDGIAAARTPELYKGQEGWLETTVVGITNVSFWWQVSSEANYDWLEFYTNGTLAKRISGEVSWQSNYFSFSRATNTLRWRYTKNMLDLFSRGQDCGWLDEVVFSPAPKGLPYTLGVPLLRPDGRFEFAIQGEAGCPCQVEYSPDLQTWHSLTNFRSSGPTTLCVDPGSSNAPTRFYRSLSP